MTYRFLAVGAFTMPTSFVVTACDKPAAERRFERMFPAYTVLAVTTEASPGAAARGAP